MNLIWSFKAFHELEMKELYEILKLRSEVFVVEQNCAYQDLDGKDEKSHHLFLMEELEGEAPTEEITDVSDIKDVTELESLIDDHDDEEVTDENPTTLTGKVIAYLRIVEPGVSYEEPSIGRVVVEKSNRNQQLGSIIMEKGIEIVKVYYPSANGIRISAQAHLQNFYQSLGFESIGKVYKEDDIDHIEMLLKF